MLNKHRFFSSNSKKTFLFSLVFLLSGTLTQTKVVVWDLGGVLFNVPTKERFRMARRLGLWDVIVHKLFERRDIKKVVFNFLEQEFGKQTPEAHCSYATGDGLELPQIMCDWMTNTTSNSIITSQDIIDRAIKAIKTSEHLQGKRERRIAQRLIRCMFDPQILAEHTCPIPQAAQLLADCATLHDINDQAVNTMFILSNYASDCFDVLANQTKSDSVFKHFDLTNNAIVSGKCHLLKPYTSIYDHLKVKLIAFDTRFLSTEFLKNECVFIDDHIENVLEARKCGITALLCDGDYDKLRQELVDLDVLPG